MSYNIENIRLEYKPKYPFNRENQVILLMITNGKKWHHLAVKGLPALLTGITFIVFINIHISIWLFIVYKLFI